MRTRPDKYGGKAHYEPWTQHPQAALAGLPPQEPSDAENSAPDASTEAGTGGDAA